MQIRDHRLHLETGPAEFRPTKNCGGELRPSYLVMHYTAGRSADSAASWLCSPAAKAAAHIVIGKDGRIVQLVPFNVVAWHAGASSWDDNGEHIVGLNHHSIGIELDNPGRLSRAGGRWRSLSLGTEYDDTDVIEAVHKHEQVACGWHVYPQAQLDAAIELAGLLIQTYALKNVIGHEDIAPKRKSDPGPAFAMDSFRSRLFGRADDGAGDRCVTSAAVFVRSGPGTQHAKVIAEPLPPGVQVAVQGAQGVWREVDVIDAVAGVNDIQGWVHGRFLRPVG